MGGRIGVISQLGRGSEFWFAVTLPLTEAPANSPALAAAPDAEGTEGAVAPKPATLDEVLAQIAARHAGSLVMVADDNLVNRELTTELLDMAGLRSVTAENGHLALDVLQGAQGAEVRAVLMDVHMPVMDGMQATRLIREDGRFGALPIIAMTASVLQQEQADCLAAGMNAHLPKPVNTHELFATLLHWLDQSAPTSA